MSSLLLEISRPIATRASSGTMRPASEDDVASSVTSTIGSISGSTRLPANTDVANKAAAAADTTIFFITSPFICPLGQGSKYTACSKPTGRFIRYITFADYGEKLHLIVKIFSKTGACVTKLTTDGRRLVNLGGKPPDMAGKGRACGLGFGPLCRLQDGVLDNYSQALW